MGETCRRANHERMAGPVNGGRSRSLLLEGAGRRDPDACKVKCLCKAVVVVVVVQHVNASVLCCGCDQRICEGNAVLPRPIRSEVS
jgi:hypothetical protein